MRLLELLPPETTNSEVIRYKLHAYALNHTHNYEAISYSWGVVNTQDCPVTVVTGHLQEFQSHGCTVARNRLRQKCAHKAIYVACKLTIHLSKV